MGTDLRRTLRPDMLFQVKSPCGPRRHRSYTAWPCLTKLIPPLSHRVKQASPWGSKLIYQPLKSNLLSVNHEFPQSLANLQISSICWIMRSHIMIHTQAGDSHGKDTPGQPGGLSGLILGSRDRVLRRAPGMELGFPSAVSSLPLSLSLSLSHRTDI